MRNEDGEVRFIIMGVSMAWRDLAWHGVSYGSHQLT